MNMMVVWPVRMVQMVCIVRMVCGVCIVYMECMMCRACVVRMVQIIRMVCGVCIVYMVCVMCRAYVVRMRIVSVVCMVCMEHKRCLAILVGHAWWMFLLAIMVVQFFEFDKLPNFFEKNIFLSSSAAAVSWNLKKKLFVNYS